MEAPPRPKRTNQDLECLKCGAFNLPENHVCGRCGANLPMVYNEEGNILKWQEDPYYASVFKSAGGKSKPSISGRWIFRLGLLAFAVFIALWILHRR